MSASYWENRYAEGGNSGAGSSGVLAQWKADFLNAFVRDNGIGTIVEWGCGDGRQLALADYEAAYFGLDVSETAIELCRARFANNPRMSFRSPGDMVDLSLSIDVIFHLVEDDVYEEYMADVFSSARRFVILYTTDSEREGAEWTAPHVRHRRPPQGVDGVLWGRDWTSLPWHRVDFVENPYPGMGGSDFYVYAR